MYHLVWQRPSSDAQQQHLDSVRPEWNGTFIRFISVYLLVVSHVHTVYIVRFPFSGYELICLVAKLLRCNIGSVRVKYLVRMFAMKFSIIKATAETNFTNLPTGKENISGEKEFEIKSLSF